jgi:peptide/nickel transport system substrate-binding protein
MNVGTIGEPKNVDPSQAYDTASGELIQNVYDSMLEFGSQSSNITVKDAAFPSGIPTIPSNDSVNVGTDVATLGSTTDVPGVCQLPTITITNATTGASVWTFKVNTNLPFQTWDLPNGNPVNENMTWQDIVYYFERFFVQDSHNSPEWMIMGPALGVANFDSYEVGTGPSLGSNEGLIAGWIQHWVIGWTDASGNQWVNMTFEYPATGMYDILCQTWCSIPPMDFSIEHGCWNDSFSVSPYVTSNGVYTQTGFASGWSAAFRRYPSDLFTPLDEHTATSQYSSSTAEPAMCGTGPYGFTTWNQATDYWRIDAFTACVSHAWPGPYGGTDPAPTTVTDTGINTWATRKMLFLSGALDICYVPTSNMYDMLVNPSIGNDYTPIPGITLYYDIPTLEDDAMFFTLNVTAGSAYMPIVNGASDPTFFSNLLVREAFCQAINSSAYISGAFYGEAIQPNTFWAVGLTPTAAYLNSTQLAPWELNVNAVYNDLQAAGINSFTLDLEYNSGNTEREIAANEIAETFAEIDALHPSVSYTCVVGSINWPTYLATAATSSMPVFIIGWLADFSDADDFAVPYMATWGAFTEWQVFSNSTIDSNLLAEEALSAYPPLTTGYNNRVAIFKTLQQEYIQNAISLPLDQPLGRHWSRDYVYGYYYNQLYPGLYYQDLYKAAPAVTQSVTLNIQSSLIPIFTYSQIYVWYGETGALGGAMMQGGGLGSNLAAPMVYYLEVSRTDGNAGEAILYATLGLGRNPGESGLSEAYGNGTEILLGYTGPTSSANATFEWLEDGVNEYMSATPTGITYTVNASSYPVSSNAVDTNPALETVTNGTFVAKTLVGDINGDGTVDIYDAISLAAAFGSTVGQSNYNPLADLNGDGVVDIYDAILLAAHFSQTVDTIVAP